MYGLPISLLCAVLSATRIWTAPSLENVCPDAAPPPGAEPHARIYAARGEYESFQVCVRSSHRSIDAVMVAGEALGADISAPDLRNVAYAQVVDDSGNEALHPDPLPAFAPFVLPEEETRAVWVTYFVPPDCVPGMHEGRLAVHLGKGVKRYVTVSVEVFEHVLPESPRVVGLFNLDREAIGSFYGDTGPDLEAWKPVYDALRPWRIACDLGFSQGNGPVSNAQALQHVLYAASAANMAAIPLGDYAAPAGADEQDGLKRAYKALANQGLASRGCIRPLPMLPRGHWAEIRETYRRTAAASPHLNLLLEAEPHPALQGLADIWLLSPRFYDPIYTQRLRKGMALDAAPAVPATAVRGSSWARVPTAGMPYASAPKDAYDGSLYTAWVSEDAPSASSPEWLELALARTVKTERLRLGWRHGGESTALTVEIKGDGTRMRPVRINWKHYHSDERFVPSWSEGSLDKPSEFNELRITMRNSRGGGPVGVTEVELAGPPDPATIEAMPPADVWFNLNGAAFPSFRIDADPVEARLFPWVCRGHNVDGFFGGPLNRWPEVWRERADADYAAWPVDDRNAGHLLYPGRRGLFPSVRLMRLRDGLEDVEYALTALEEGIETDFSAGKAVRPCRWEHFDLEPKPEALADAAGHIERIRVEIGRALSRGNTGGIE